MLRVLHPCLTGSNCKLCLPRLHCEYKSVSALRQMSSPVELTDLGLSRNLISAESKPPNLNAPRRKKIYETTTTPLDSASKTATTVMNRLRSEMLVIQNRNDHSEAAPETPNMLQSSAYHLSQQLVRFNRPIVLSEFFAGRIQDKQRPFFRP